METVQRHPDQCQWKSETCTRDRDPAHPRSPYCPEHRQQARSESQARSRERRKAAADLLGVLKAPRRHTLTDGTYTGPLGVALTPDAASAARDVYGRLLVALTAASTNTHGYKARKPADPQTEYVLTQLRDLAAAVADLNEVIGPALYGSKPDLEK